MQPTVTWDQVLAFGEYQHVTVEDQPVITVFDASKCRVMLDDFATRKNDIFVDRRHEVAEDTSGTGDELLAQVDAWGQTDGRALAWSDALAMVVAGVVVKYVRHQSAPENPPTLNELRRPDGSYPEDGVYARRYLVTPLGADPKEGLPSFRYTSPYFVPMRDGWRLLNYTATNDPRMEGVTLGAIEMHRQADGSWAMASCGLARMGRQTMQRVAKRAASTMEHKPMPDMTPESKAAIMKAAGCMDEDDAETKLGKVMAYHAGQASKAEEARAKMEADASEMKRKMEEESRHRMEDDRKAEEEEARKAARKAQRMEEEERRLGRKMTDEERAKFEAGEHKEPDGDEKAAMQAMSRENRALSAKVSVLEKELAKVSSLLPTLEIQAKESQSIKALEWAHEAIAMGRYPHDAEGDIDKTAAKLQGEYLSDAKTAEKMLFSRGKFPAPAEAQAMKRLTHRGAGIGAPQPKEGPDTTSVASRMSEAIAMTRKKRLDQKLPIDADAEMKEIQQSDPELYNAYWNGR
jgi:hypothetical protein